MSGTKEAMRAVARAFGEACREHGMERCQATIRGPLVCDDENGAYEASVIWEPGRHGADGGEVRIVFEQRVVETLAASERQEVTR